MLLLGLALLTATPEVHLEEPQPLSFLLSTPTGEIAAVNSSEIIRILDELFAAHTNLRPVLLDASLMDECRGRLVCLSLKARPDYRREALMTDSGELAPFREHVDRLRRDGVVYSRYLLVLTNVTREGQPDRMSALLVDTDQALALFHAADRRRDGWEDDLEARVAASAVLAEVRRKEIPTAALARGFMNDLFTKTLRPPLEEAGYYEPYGALEITCDVEGAGISIDGTTVGVTQDEPIAVRRVRPGTHVIELTDPKHAPFTVSVLVERGQTAPVSVDLRALENNPSRIADRIVFWSGIALSVIGAGVLVAAVATQDRDLVTACFDEPGGDCSGGSAFTTLGARHADDTAPEDVNPRGLLLGPFGYSLIGAGATFTVGSLFEEDSAPWISLIAGLVIGGTAYGLSAALDGPHL